MKNIRKYILIILLLSGIFVVSDIWNARIGGENKVKRNALNKTDGNAFNNIKIEARSVFVYDVKEDKILFAKNEEKQIPLASLTKVMTALVATKNTDKDSMLAVRRSNLKPEGDSGLLVNEKWSLKNLLDFTLVSSSNDGANMLASAGAIGINGTTNLSEEDALSRDNFIKKMNDVARELGMSQTYFLNESGLDINKNIAGAYGSAKDMAILFSYVLKNRPNLLEATTYKTLNINSSHVSHKAKNTDSITDEIPGLVASKTGFTNLSGGNLVIAYEAGPMRPIIISVMGSSVDGRFADMKKLVAASLLAIKYNK